MTKVRTDIQRLPRSQVKLTVHLSREEIDRLFDRVYQRLSQSARIRGFRPGKAPRPIIRSYFGADRIRAAVWMEVLEGPLQEAVQQAGLRIVGEPALPALEEVDLAEGQPLSFPVVLEVWPEVHVEPLEGVKILELSPEITEEDVDRTLEELREQNPNWQETDEAVQPGDRVTADIKGYLGDDENPRIDQQDVQFIAAEPEQREQAEAEADEGEVGPIIAQAVVGHKPGETIEVRHTYGEGEEREDWRFVAVIKKVERPQKRELNDEFAKSLGDYENLEQLKQAVREELERKRRRTIRETTWSQAWAWILAKCDVELPESMVENVTDMRLRELEQDLESSGLTLEQLAAEGVVELDQLRARQRERAERALEMELALEAVAEKYRLEPREEDIEAEIEELAEESGNTVEFVRQAFEVQPELEQRIRRRARIRRVLTWIIENAQVETVPPEEFDRRYRDMMRWLAELRQKRRRPKPQRRRPLDWRATWPCKPYWPESRPPEGAPAGEGNES